MSKPANPKMIGAFVLGAFALVVLGVIYFGGAQFFAERNRYVMYFAGSVKGLRVGAPVTWRGVPIGQVDDINLLYNPDKLRFFIEVIVEVNPQESIEIGNDTKQRLAGDELQKLIAKGLRAQLVQQSFVTGQLAIQVSMFPGTQARLLGLNPDITEIPTVPSTFAQIEEAVTTIVKRLEEMRIDEIISDLKATTVTIRDLISAPEVKETVINADQALREVRQLAAKLNARVDPLADSARRTLNTGDRAMREAERTFIEAREALQGTEKLLSTADGVIRPGSPLHFELVNALREVGSAARSLKSFADTLERNPDALLFGRRKPGGQ